MRAAIVTLLVAALLAGCAASSDPPAPASTSPPAQSDSGGGPQALASLGPFRTAEAVLRGPEDSLRVPVYVADTKPLRRRGLMGVQSLPEGAGMVFLFPDERRGGFWMKDTLIPLSIAFSDAQGTVVAILDMEPCRADPCPDYDPGVAYSTALEVGQGWFEKAGVEPGWRLELPPGLEGS